MEIQGLPGPVSNLVGKKGDTDARPKLRLDGPPGRCNKNTPRIRGKPGNGINLLKWPEKFQSEEAHVPCRFLAADLGRNRRRLVWYKA